MQREFTLTATPNNRRGYLTYVSTIHFKGSTIELIQKSMCSDGFDPEPYEVRNDIIQRQDIKSVKLCKRNMDGWGERVKEALKCLFGMFLLYSILERIDESIIMINLVVCFGLFFVVIYSNNSWSSLRVILVKQNDGKQYIIPWHGDVAAKLSE